MSRLIWVGVGAVGGIYAYRKTTRTIDDARDRSFRENLTWVAKQATNVAASARYLATLNSDESSATVVDIQSAGGSRRSRP